MAHLSNIEGIEMEGKLPEVRLASTPFKVVSPYEPAGDQPQAIEKLATGVKEGLRYQNLLGVTGSGKTFTMAKVIEAVQKPTLVMAPNKTLAAQLASELKEFFLTTPWCTSCRTTITTSPRRTCPRRTRSSRRTRPSTKRWRNCVMRPRRLCCRGAIASWWRRCTCIYGIGSPMDYAGHGRVRGQAEGHGSRPGHP